MVYVKPYLGSPAPTIGTREVVPSEYLEPKGGRNGSGATAPRRSAERAGRGLARLQPARSLLRGVHDDPTLATAAARGFDDRVEPAFVFQEDGHPKEDRRTGG